MESASLGIAEYVQQKAEMKIISLEECQDRWDSSLGPLLHSQGQTQHITSDLILLFLSLEL